MILLKNMAKVYGFAKADIYIFSVILCNFQTIHDIDHLIGGYSRGNV